MDEVPEVQEKIGAPPMHAIEGVVELENVEAEYVPGEPVLKKVSLSAQPGETVAIVGPTGAGKTTIINLLPRFWDVTGGSVRIDGVDVRDVKLHSLRQQIGLVLQDTYLFSSSVMDNIRFSQSDASDEEVIAAAKLAQAHDFIALLPDGYETVLGERGSGLSQGQRQLLAIARAALADPRILILDEATSSVDTRTEQKIQAALNDLLKGRTSFVIAHRLSTIRSADQVLVLRDGEIIERGTHEGLAGTTRLLLRSLYEPVPPPGRRARADQRQWTYQRGQCSCHASNLRRSTDYEIGWQDGSRPCLTCAPAPTPPETATRPAGSACRSPLSERYPTAPD